MNYLMMSLIKKTLLRTTAAQGCARGSERSGGGECPKVRKRSKGRTVRGVWVSKPSAWSGVRGSHAGDLVSQFLSFPSLCPGQL